MSKKLAVTNSGTQEQFGFVVEKFAWSNNNFRGQLSAFTATDPTPSLVYPMSVSMRLISVKGQTVMAVIDETGWTGFNECPDKLVAVVSTDNFEVVARIIAKYVYGDDECFATCDSKWFTDKMANLPPCFCTNGHGNEAGGWCCPHVGNTCGHDHWWNKHQPEQTHVVELVEGTSSFGRHWNVDNSRWLSYDGYNDCVSRQVMPQSVRDAIRVKNRELRG